MLPDHTAGEQALADKRIEAERRSLTDELNRSGSVVFPQATPHEPKEAAMNPVKPYLILSQDCWQIKVRLPAQPTMETAEKSANSPHLDIRFVRVDGRPAIQTTIAGESITHFDEDVVIEELSDTKRAVMGKPLDATDPGDGDIMIRALKDEDPSYTMTSADMVPSSRHIKDFLDVYGEGYRPECIAFGVESAVA